MEIKLKTLKFDADEKLTAFVEKKVSRLERFFLPGVPPQTEVTLEEVKEGKKVKLKIHLPGDELIIERTADTFENAVTGSVDAMKEKLTRTKEKLFDK